jgi:cell division protein FtsI/penicillin-binding protein 2
MKLAEIFGSLAESKSQANKRQIIDAAKAVDLQQDYLEAIDAEISDSKTYTRDSLNSVMGKLGLEHFVDDICDRLGLV